MNSPHSPHAAFLIDIEINAETIFCLWWKHIDSMDKLYLPLITEERYCCHACNELHRHWLFNNHRPKNKMDWQSYAGPEAVGDGGHRVLGMTLHDSAQPHLTDIGIVLIISRCATPCAGIVFWAVWVPI